MKYLNYIIGFLLLFPCALASSQVSINNGNPNPSSILDLDDNSNDRGLMPPKGELQMIATGVSGNGENNANAGLLMFDEIDNKYYFFDGQSWQLLNPFTRVTNPGNTANTIDGNLTTDDPVEFTNDVTIDGDLQVNGFSQNALVPTGAIIMWSGITPPDGWELCDGEEGRPNLMGRFIVGHDPNDGRYNNPGRASTGGSNVADVGGLDEVTLTQNQMPAHNHTMSNAGAHSHTTSTNINTWFFRNVNPTINNQAEVVDGFLDLTYVVNEGPIIDRVARGGGDNISTRSPSVPLAGTTNFAGSHTHTINNRGGNQAHENRPPYYTLAYIIKLP